MGKMPAGAIKRKNGLWAYPFYVKLHGRNVRKYVYGHTSDELLEKAEQKRQEFLKGEYTTNKRITLNQLYKEWYNEKRGTIKESSLSVYQKHYDLYIKKNLGSYKVKDIERRQIVLFMQKIAAKHSAKVANSCKSLIFSLLKYAELNEIVFRNVAQGIPLLKVDRNTARETIHRELTEEEEEIFFRYCKNSAYYPAFQFMLKTGVRAGECLALQWRDIGSNVIHIRRTMTKSTNDKFVVGDSPKTRAGLRDIPINAEIQSIIDSQREIYRATHTTINLSDPVFPSEHGTFSNVGILNGIIARILNRIRADGIPFRHFSSHAFRDTFATRAYRANMPGNVLKEILGHEHFDMTMDLYSHVNMNDKIIAMNRLNAPIEPLDKKKANS